MPRNAAAPRAQLTVFATRVNHPGAAAQPFMRPAAAVGQRILQRNVDQAFAMARTKEELPKLLDLAVAKTAFFVQFEAQKRAPVSTGRLRSSINTQKRGDGFYTVGTNVAYAIPVEEGSRPHPILPRRARVLRFTVPVVGRSPRRA